MTLDFTKPAPVATTLEEANGLIAVLWQHVQLLTARCEALERENQELRAKVEELSEKLNTSSRNSSKPPSSDGPSQARTHGGRLKAKGGRKRGGQKGHPGSRRDLLPAQEVDKVVPCRPKPQCECGGLVVVDEGVPDRRQQLELPKVKPYVTEFQIYGGCCTRCGKRHRGQLPQGVPEGLLGVRGMALVGTLTGRYRLSKRNTAELLFDLYGLRISPGTVSKTEERVSEALVAPYEQAAEYVQEQSVVNVDETGHKICGRRGWMWVAIASTVAVFLVACSRGAAVAKELLGEAFSGIVQSDRWSAYSWVSAALRQLCWAHLLRDFVKIAERAEPFRSLGQVLLVLTVEMFRVWDRFKTGELDRQLLREEMAPIREQIEAKLEYGASLGVSKTAETCKKILAVRQGLWTFVEVEGVEPTNNLAERAIRNYVLWRKTSFGTQSERGDRFMERVMTVSTTLRLQGRNVLDFITETVQAHLLQLPAPSLLPDDALPNLRRAAA